MKAARSDIDRRDLKPDNMPLPVETRWIEEVDPRRLRRVAEILADILDNQTTPGDGGRR